MSAKSRRFPASFRWRLKAAWHRNRVPSGIRARLGHPEAPHMAAFAIRVCKVDRFLPVHLSLYRSSAGSGGSAAKNKNPKKSSEPRWGGGDVARPPRSGNTTLGTVRPPLYHERSKKAIGPGWKNLWERTGRRGKRRQLRGKASASFWGTGKRKEGRKESAPSISIDESARTIRRLQAPCSNTTHPLRPPRGGSEIPSFSLRDPMCLEH